MYSIHLALSESEDKRNWKQYFRVFNISKHVHTRRTPKMSASPAASVWILNIQTSESPLLILKEALYVIHNEIKAEKKLPSLPSPPSSPLSFLSHQIIWMCREEAESEQEKGNGESHSEWDEGRGKVKIQTEETKYESFPPSLHLCCSPNHHRGSLGASSFWWMIGPLLADPGTYTGDKRAEGWKENKSGLWMCVLLLGSVWLCTFKTLQDGNGCL